jgi:hypothetical protein
MSWSDEHIQNILLYRFIYANKFEVEQRLLELSEDINTCSSKIKMFAASSPSAIIPKDSRNEPIDWLNDEIDSILALIQDYITQKYELELYLKYLEETVIDSDQEENINNITE